MDGGASLAFATRHSRPAAELYVFSRGPLTASRLISTCRAFVRKGADRGDRLQQCQMSRRLSIPQGSCPRPSIAAARPTIVIAITTPEPPVTVAIAEAKDDRRSAVVTASVYPIAAHRTVVRPDMAMPPPAPNSRTVSTVNLLD